MSQAGGHSGPLEHCHIDKHPAEMLPWPNTLGFLPTVTRHWQRQMNAVRTFFGKTAFNVAQLPNIGSNVVWNLVIGNARRAVPIEFIQSDTEWQGIWFLVLQQTIQVLILDDSAKVG
ncbi:hypothetical protein B0A52_04445 [Exophiala mesophila]|uniref:Uncharacterized protein n=1 Tax=Exophiala mesophila TaxID=212818 RepID=A0A438N9E6_EXOME|nr:hypothetical protein B0A52_04445 [Exophiala mesophila]